MSETRASAVPSADTDATLDPRRWLVLGTVALAQLMVVLDATIVNIALPSAQRPWALAPWTGSARSRQIVAPVPTWHT